MSTRRDKSFVRWQGRSIAQLGYVNNLLIGLATGMLAFQTNQGFQHSATLSGLEVFLLVASTILVFLSLGVGCCLACNRLLSFRATTRVARLRETQRDPRRGEPSIGELRAIGKKRDQWTWRLLWTQVALFALGALALAVATICAYVC